MALVILPCDLPHWCNLQKQLSFLSTVNNEKLFIEGMFKIHNLCNISTGLDPDEPEKLDPNMFSSLENFLTNLANDEKVNFFQKILPIMTRRALDLKALKPKSGFHFSLQQQGDEMIYKRSFLASLLAHSFFSTFPKRTWKTHPTLQDFNFTFFFKFLDQAYQQAKLKSIFYYFELLEDAIDENECVTYSRQVMSGKQWLTINDWMESCLPLCPITIRNDGSLNDVEPQCLRICFSSPKIGGSVLGDGISQESVEFCTIPELICILASVEALEDNEVLLIKDAYQVSQIKQPKEKAILEKLAKPSRVCLCCMDAEDYAIMPLSQLEEDNVLRELNKALLGFRQGKTSGSKYKISSKAPILRRLSPIGESFNSTPREHYLSKDESPFSVSPSTNLGSPETKNCWLKLPTNSRRSSGIGADGRRGRFIVLGSSGECLPVNRTTKGDDWESMRAGNSEMQSVNRDALFSSAQSEDEEEIFHSAQTSIDNESDDPIQDGNNEGNSKSNSINLNFSFDEEILSFTERLREALLRGARTYNTKTDDSSYAVDISVSDSADEENNVRCKRGTSTGFILEEESLEDGFYQDSSEKECNRGRNQSDKYSFTTDESDLDVYDHFSKWISASDRDIGNSVNRKEAISDFASTLLKRAFSDTYAVVGESSQDKKRAIMLARSFSLELAKRNPKLAAQLVNFLSGKDLTLKSILPNKNGQRAVGTGNWGCGSCHGGDPQIKLTIQWLAASYTGLPNLIYYTYRHQKLVKLDTVRRVLIDRGWTVGQLATSLLQYAHMSLHDSHSSTLFDSLITSLHG